MDFPVMSRFILGSSSLTQLTCRFNGRTVQPLGACPPPGCDEPTSRVNSIITNGTDYIFILSKSNRSWRIIAYAICFIFRLYETSLYGVITQFHHKFIDIFTNSVVCEVYFYDHFLLCASNHDAKLSR